MSEPQPTIKTRILVISDTHGRDIIQCNESADVAIHCGDLTRRSMLEEYESAITLLKRINAPLKLVIAGNHDFTLDPPAYQDKIREAERLQIIDPRVIELMHGTSAQVRELFDHADVREKSGIRLLDEGTHHFTLNNGASLTVYASPYTPCFGDWGFQYSSDGRHDFAIGDADVVVTHGPPRGILDDNTLSDKLAGCEYLFEKIAHSRPLMHCFGHIHGGWGAKLVTWNETQSEKPSHLADIDHDKSTVIEDLASLKASGRRPYCLTGHSSDDANPLQHGAQTLFVNAAVESSGPDDLPVHPAWLVDLDLPAQSHH
ncbi:putative metallophosphoesterase domain-containing protein [Aspergillus campestris IBT 28561]|uniref:Metallophosphoesterase domain-containing protein n=1 Tax=Aspergillus campestris (strain IBT 28561) TaxID=1392248 RepID=A0A2I1CY55_ASPC2|nr:putative metallophosphoesterase domain-containing protein [Aspergillus campestris IBT 28561]PKY02546.1 putative metallophosphoesterase domain-containing protein [Aspergillus campestris IBT 28561]